MSNIVDELERLKKVNQWLEIELEQFRVSKEQELSGISPGTGDIPQIVPPIAPDSLRKTVGSPSLSGHLIVSDGWYFLISWLLKKKSTILDIGCGCGKPARMFLHHPFVERYIGLDNYERSIQWCQEHITPLSPENFRFIFADVFSEAYNPKGKIKACEFVFPLDDAEVDIAMASSLFTHLLEEDTINYLKQIKRVLKTSGILVASIHTDTHDGEKYSGNEIRIDVKTSYFIELAESCGLVYEQDLGILLGQEVLIFKSC